MVKGIYHLVIALTLLSLLAVVDSSYAAGRVFYDGFEDGTTNAWAQDDFRNKCTVVTSSLDGHAGPHNGSRMARCNWNGIVAWNDQAAVETLQLSNWTYSSEILIRFYVRTDADVDKIVGSGGKYLRVGVNSGGTSNTNWALHALEGQQMGAFFGETNQIGGTYWGGGSHAADGNWHKVEFYIKQSASAGVIRMWEDDVLLWQGTGNTQFNPGGTWADLHIMSNWSGAPGCCDHDANNHAYWDEFEIYSDTGTGATGSMSDATISNGSGSNGSSGQTVPTAPQNAQVVVTP
jgi:hypothetical protein